MYETRSYHHKHWGFSSMVLFNLNGISNISSIFHTVLHPFRGDNFSSLKNRKGSNKITYRWKLNHSHLWAIHISCFIERRSGPIHFIQCEFIPCMIVSENIDSKIWKKSALARGEGGLCLKISFCENTAEDWKTLKILIMWRQNSKLLLRPGKW